ncbi:translocation/assembly module TamB domain-containing protein [Pikeienuella sp. HZG-20]|uniref:translocation/assembly module TamB domain-containing protein n=1 Tax=Paludibacillus litoralis TaxID=3133267 RepID=UPI0030EBCDCD
MRRLASLLLVLALLAAPPAMAFSFLGLKNSLVDFVLDQISVPGELEITAEGVEDAEDGATEIVGLKVADGDGVWMTVERLSVRWTPSRVLRGELAINRLAAIGVDVLRAPAASAVDIEVKEGAPIAQTDREPFDWPRAPITTKIEALELTRVAVAGGIVAAQSLDFDAKGALTDEGDEQSLRFEITRTDAVAGRILIDYLRNFADNRLNLTLEADEAAGGLVAALAGIPNESASRLRLKAEGPLTEWALTLDGEVERVIEAAGTARVDAAGRLSALADLTVTPGPALAETYGEAVAAALSPAARLKFDIAEDEDGIVHIQEGTLKAADLSLSAEGAYDRNGKIADLDVRLEARAGLAALVEGVEFAGFGFEGALKGPLDDLSADGAVTLSGLKTAAADVGAADLMAKARVKGEVITVDVSGAAMGVRLDRLTPELLGDAKITVKGVYDGAAARLDILRFDAAPLTLEARGAADLTAETLDFSYRLEAPKLGPLAAAYDQDAAGALSAAGRVSGPLSLPRLDGGLTLEGLSYQGESYGAVRLTHDATFGAAPEGTATLTASGSRFGAIGFDGGFRLDGDALALRDMTATGLGATIEGALDVDLKTTLISGAVTLDAPDLAPLEAVTGAPASGAAAGRVTLAPEAGKQNVDLDLTLDGIDAADMRVASGTLNAKISDALGAPAATGALEARGVSALGQYSAARIALSGEASDLTGAPGFDISGEIDGADFGAGRIASTAIALKGDLADLTATIRARGLAADGAAAETATLDARIREAAGGDPLIGATLRVGALGFAGGRLGETALTAEGRLSALALTLDSNGALEARETPLRLSAAARADLLDAEGPKATVSRLALTLGEDEIALRAPLRIASAGGTTRFDGIDLGLPGGALTGRAALHGGGISGDLLLDAPDLGPLAALAELPLEQGALRLDARFDTRAGSAGADLKLSADGLRFADRVADIGALDLEADLGWNGREADVDATLSGPFKDPVRLSAAAPLRPTGGLLPAVPRGGALSGAVDWAGRLGDFWALVPAPGHVLDGDARVALRLSGTVAKPVVGGDVRLTDGQYQNLDLGTILVKLNVNSTVGADGAFLIDMTAEDGSGGPVSARIALADGELDATVSANGATLVRRDDVTAALTLDLRAAGPLAAPDISGTVNIDRAEVRLVAATPPGVADLGEVRIKGEPPKPEPKASGGDIGLHIDVSGDDDIYVRGRGLDSEWEIDLEVRGTAAAPVITGAILKRRGVLSLLGRDFDLERGAIRFNGGTEINPALDVQLLRENDGVRGGIAVSGSALKPEVNFISRPSLPEEEVLPRVLFGQSKQSLSPSEALSLAVGVATLLDGAGGTTDSVRGAIGLDVLRIDEGENGPSVTVGSNVAKGVFVGAKQPIGSGSGSVIVELEVIKNITIDSEVGPDVGTSIGVKWKKDF